MSSPPKPLSIEEEIMSYYKNKADFEAAMLRISKKAAKEVGDGFFTGIPAPERVKDKEWGLWYYLKNIDDRAFNAGQYAWIAAYGTSDKIADAVAKKVGSGTDVKAAVKEAISELASADAEVKVEIKAGDDK